MSQLKKVKEELSFIWGKKPIVYLITEDLDLVDMLFEYDPHFCPKDVKEGKEVNVDKGEYVKQHYNSSTASFWRSLVDEGGSVSMPPSIKKRPAYCYVKNCDYLMGLSMDRRFESTLYGSLMSYVSEYQALPKEQKGKNILLLSGSSIAIPDGISSFVEIIDVPFPDEEDVMRLLRQNGVLTETTPSEILNFWKAKSLLMKGFTNMQIQDVIGTVLSYYASIGSMSNTVFQKHKKDIEEVLHSQINSLKLQIVKKNGVLQFVDYPADPKDIHASGCDNVEAFIGKRKDLFLHPKNYVGVAPPKGILFSGVPGTGKSLMAKKTAAMLGVPLLKLDIGSLMGKYVGESEGQLRRALKMAESVAPCVLFIDELDKAFSVNQNSHESTQRMFGYMLGWMQDCKAPVFIYATANHIKRLDSAFLRSGRFDNKFFAFMPTMDQCIDIVKGCIEKIKKEYERVSVSMFEASCSQNVLMKRMIDIMDYAAEKGKFFNGADINSMVNLTIAALYYRKIYPPYYVDDFFDVMKDELKSMCTYGQSSMSEIAYYWLQNRFNTIEPSDEPFFEFEDFDIERKNPNAKTNNEKEQNSYFIPRGKRYFTQRSQYAEKYGRDCNYDHALYTALVNHIDKMQYYEIKSYMTKND